MKMFQEHHSVEPIFEVSCCVKEQLGHLYENVENSCPDSEYVVEQFENVDSL